MSLRFVYIPCGLFGFDASDLPIGWFPLLLCIIYISFFVYCCWIPFDSRSGRGSRLFMMMLFYPLIVIYVVLVLTLQPVVDNTVLED